MSRAGITYHDVAKAAGQLYAEGKIPTVDTVRIALGNTGSKGTIAPHLKRWKEENQVKVERAGRGLPPELVEAVQSVHERMQATVQLQLDEQESAHQQALQIWREETATLTQEFDKAGTTIQTLSRQLDHAQCALAELQASHHEQAVQLATVTADNAGLTKRLTDQRAANEDLSRQLRETREQMTHYQEAVSRQRAEERHAAEQRQAHLEQELAATQQHLRDSETLQVQAQAEARQLQSSLTLVRNDLQATHKTASETQQLCNQRGYRLAEMEQAHESLQEAHSMAQTALGQARTDLAVVAAEKRLQAELITRMDNEKAGLQSQLQTSQQERAALENDLRQLQASLAPNAGNSRRTPE